jgi:hypothetical protein
MSQEGNTLSFDDMWIRLLEGIEHVYQGQAMSAADYIELYT